MKRKEVTYGGAIHVEHVHVGGTVPFFPQSDMLGHTGGTIFIFYVVFHRSSISKVDESDDNKYLP